MFEGKRVLAIIPARGGSKGLPGKNIRPLAGKPLIAWTIEAAKSSEYIDKIIVSSDSQEICQIAEQHGAEVPFIRPAELATDHAKGTDVILHAVDWLEQNDEYFDLILVLQPTSPLRTTSDIDGALAHYAETGAKSVVSVCKTDHHPWWSNTLPANGEMIDFIPAKAQKNRQELPEYYRLNGAIYLSERSYLNSPSASSGIGTFAYIMDTDQSIDIDSLLDLKLAELLILEHTAR